MKSRWSHAIGVCVALAAAGSVLRADLIVRRDGSIVEGKVISRDSKGLVVQPDGQKTASNLTLAADDVARVLVVDDKGTVLQEAAGTATPAKRADRRFEIPVEPKAPAVVPAPAGASYYVIPLHGVVGETILADALEKSLADAVKRKPSVVVLDINSPGGKVVEAEAMMKVLHNYNKQLRIVVLADQNLSAAAITSLSAKEIYVKSTSTTGAATAYNPVDPDLPADIKEKMQSAWRAVARNSAQEGGHEPLLAEAMIDSSRTLHLDTSNDKKVVKEGPGEKVLCQTGKILTLTSHEAVDCGLAAGITDDYAELGTALKLNNWKECPGLGQALGEYLPKRWASYDRQTKELDAAILGNIVAIKASAPDSDVITQRIVTSPMGGRGLGGGYPPGYVPGGGYMPGGVPMPGGRGMGGGMGGGIGGRGGVGTPGIGGGVQQSIIVTRSVSPQMRAKWKDNSLATVVAFEQLEQNATDEMALARAFGQTAEADDIKDSLLLFAMLRGEIYLNRNKYINDPSARGPATTTAPATLPALAAKNKPLPLKFANQVEDSVSKVSFRVGKVIGRSDAGGEFQEFSRDGGLLIGLRCGLAKIANTVGIVVSVQPMFLSNNGVKLGKWYGNPAPPEVIDLVAKDGYAVGSIGVAEIGSDYIGSISLKFMKIGDGVLEPNDSYQSDHVGDHLSLTNEVGMAKGGTAPMPGVIGISGRTNNTSGLALGLVFMPAPPAAAVSATRPATSTAPATPAFTVLSPTPISADIGAAAKKCIDAKSYGYPFHVGNNTAKDPVDTTAGDGVLVGLRCGLGKSGNADAIVSVQPIFLNSQGTITGPIFGNPSGARVVELRARDGFMVGGVELSRSNFAGTNCLQSVKLTFVRLTAGTIDTKDSYESDAVGTIGLTSTFTPSKPFVGISVRGGTTTNLGLALLRMK